MPIYDYGCQNCSHRVEVIHGVHESGPLVCSVCGGPMRKLLSAPAIVFKGTGWAKKERASYSATRAAPASGGEHRAQGESGSSEEKSAPSKTDGNANKPGGRATTAGE